jgi:hypothetical protein
MRPVSRIVLCLALLIIASSAVSAQKQKAGTSAVTTAVTTKDKKTTIVTTPSGVRTPYVDDNAGLSVIFSNLATDYPNGLYWCCQGVTVSGPNSPFFVEWWHAAAFTPTTNATVAKVTVSVGYLAGNGKINLSLNADDGGIPGAVLEQWTLYKLGEAGTCCTVQSRKTAGVALTAGQQYWIVASTDADSSVWAAWNQADNDQVSSFLNAGYTNQFGAPAWQSYTTNLNVAFAVYGQ